MNFTNYQDKVFEILESFHYPEMVEFYEAECVAHTLAKTIQQCYTRDLSYRICAILIWSLTMTEKIIPESKQSTIN